MNGCFFHTSLTQLFNAKLVCEMIISLLTIKVIHFQIHKYHKLIIFIYKEKISYFLYNFIQSGFIEPCISELYPANKNKLYQIVMWVRLRTTISKHDKSGWNLSAYGGLPLLWKNKQIYELSNWTTWNP